MTAPSAEEVVYGAADSTGYPAGVVAGPSAVVLEDGVAYSTGLTGYPADGLATPLGLEEETG